MDKYVSQEECEERRNSLIDEVNQNSKAIEKLYGEIKALTVQVENLVSSNKWFMAIIGTVLGGLLVWLITRS